MMSAVSSTTRLRFAEVLPHEFTRKPELIRMHIARFKATDGAKVVKALPQLPDDYRHLKRVRKITGESGKVPVLEIVLGAVEGSAEAGVREAAGSIQTNISEGVDEGVVKEEKDEKNEAENLVPENLRQFVLSFDVVEVSKHEAVTPEQLNELGKFWPLTYRRPAFQPLDLSDKKFLERLEKHHRSVLEDKETCCIVFPTQNEGPSPTAPVGKSEQESFNEPPAKRLKKESAVSSTTPDVSSSSTNPLETSTTTTTIGTAETSTTTIVTAATSSSTHPHVSPLLPASIVGRRNHSHPLKHSIINALDKVGHILCGECGDGRDARKPNDEDVPYLCVDAEVFVEHEPCIMCAMALVHSRVKTVVFSKDNKEFGGFGGRVALQHEKRLNHHVRVLKAEVLEGE